MSKILLEKYLNKNPKIFLALNSIVMNVKRFSDKEASIELLRDYVDDAEKLFNDLVKDKYFDIFLKYECEDENHSAILLEEKCKYCDEKIEEHEYYLLYRPNFNDILLKYNEALLEEYFDKKSFPVIRDLQKKMERVIPFVGAGMSKPLGYPLWKDLFLPARDDFEEGFENVFDRRYDSDDIDALIAGIFEFNAMIADEKDLKMRVLEPQLEKKFNHKDMEQSSLPKLLELKSDYIITTNYDDALSQCNNLYGHKYNVTKNILNFEGFENLYHKNFIFHIHGNFDHLESMIVTNKNYDALYSEEKNKRILTGLISKKSLLFLGFSLNDKYFSKEFQSICDSNSGYSTNYMVLINSTAQKEKEILESNNVKFICLKAEENDQGDYETKEQYDYLFDILSGSIYI